MAKQRERLKGLGRRAGALLFSGMLAVSLAPAIALADVGLEAQSANLETQHYDYVNNSGKIAFDANGNPLGSEVELLGADTANHVYTYRGYAHSDNGSHYKGYSLITALKTDANNILTSIDLTSDNTTFAGMWGYARGKGAASIDGYVPDGVTFDVIANADGTYTPHLVDPKYGMTLSKVALISTNADGTKDATGGSDKVDVPYTGDDMTKIDVSSVDACNLIRFTYQTSNEKMPFDCYYCIEGAYLQAAEAYCDDVVGDKDGMTVYTDNPSTGYTTNRDGWTAIMGTLMLRELSSWGSVLSGASTVGGLADELGGIDTVSGATKTSEPFVGAVQAAYQAGYVKGVSENVKITLDGATALPSVDVNAKPQDLTSVSEDGEGNYVVKTSFQQYGGGRLSLNKIFLMDLSDMELGTQGMLTLAKTFNVYDDAAREANDFETGIVASYAPTIRYNATDDVTGGDENCEYVFSKPTGSAPLAVAGNGTLTIKNESVTHVIVNYTLGHGDVAIAYDLAEMAKVPEVTALLEAATSADEASVSAARAAYDAMPYDVRPFTTGIDNLEAAEAGIVSTQLAALTTGSSASAVTSARNAYDALDAAAQAKIASVSYNKLIAAEKAIAAKTIKKGDVKTVSGQAYKVTKVATAKANGTVTFSKAKSAKSVTVPASVKLADGRTYNVTKIAASSFKGSKATKVTVKTANLSGKASVKNCFKGSKVASVKVPSKKLTAYKKIFTKANTGSSKALAVAK